MPISFLPIAASVAATNGLKLTGIHYTYLYRYSKNVMFQSKVLLPRPFRPFRPRVACRCIKPEDIERTRNTLRTNYYSTVREIRFDEVEMILKPLFQEIRMDITVVKNKVHLQIVNTPPPPHDHDSNFAILDLVNEWGMNDRFRRFLIKGITNANKHSVHRYNPGMKWICPLDVYYVFKTEDAAES